ncbi:MAG: histidinol-phosphate transaminase [Pirellulales bacterium]|nr:histidinol-phosphate transaminase [Pirellulales bacterium]
MTYVRPNIDAMQGYVPGEQPPPGKYIKLNTNENPYPPSPAVAQAIQTAVAGLERYPDPTGLAFRTRAAELLGVEPDWILCGNGSDDLLTICTRAFVGEGETLRLPYPSYTLYRTLANIQGAKYEEIQFNRDWTLPPDFSASHESLRLAFLPNPNSPSGTVLDTEEIRKIAERLDRPFIVDEAYGDFADTNCIDLVRQCPNVIVTRTLSKSYALAGLRFGFLIAQPDMVAQLAKVKDSYNCDALSIAGATAAIDDQTWLAENRAKIIATRARLSAAMSELGFVLSESQANFAWATHPEHAAKELFASLKSARILVRYMDYAGWGDGLRVTVGTDEQIDAFLTVLRSLV